MSEIPLWDGVIVLFGKAERFLPDFPQCLLRLARFKGSMPIRGPVHADFRLGLGATRYEEVQTEIRSFSGASTRTGLLEECTRFTVETRLGVSVRLDSSAFTAGFGSRSIEGADTEVNSSRFDPHTFWTFDLDLGVEIRF